MSVEENKKIVAKFFDNAERAVARGTAEGMRDAVLACDRGGARVLADALSSAS